MGANHYDVIVVGGGIVGLATAREILQRYRLRLLVLEKESHLASHQTGHNSGVIHSGLYYQPGSLKARLCVEGAERMVRFCAEHGIAHEVCGKVVVATSAEEIPALEELHRRGEANGVAGIRVLDPQGLKELEPHSHGVRALHVPTTGITAYSDVALKYAELLQQRGGEVLAGAEVRAIDVRSDAIVLQTPLGEFSAGMLVNSAGLFSDRLCRMAGVDPGLHIVPFRGEYYELTPARRSLVKNLIYPVPDPKFPFLGVHFTRRITGGIEAGPNAVLALRREGYRRSDVRLGDLLELAAFPGFWKMSARHWRSGMGEYHRSLSKSAFVRGLQKLLPEVTAADLAPAGAGVRAQAVDATGALVNDFRIQLAPRMVHILNVPSPAATASLTIAEHIVSMSEEMVAAVSRSRPGLPV